MAVYWRAWAPTPIWNTSTGSRTAPLERMLTMALSPDLRTLVLKRLSEMLALPPLSNILASSPVTVTVPEKGSPK